MSPPKATHYCPSGRLCSTQTGTRCKALHRETILSERPLALSPPRRRVTCRQYQLLPDTQRPTQRPSSAHLPPSVAWPCQLPSAARGQAAGCASRQGGPGAQAQARACLSLFCLTWAAWGHWASCLGGLARLSSRWPCSASGPALGSGPAAHEDFYFRRIFVSSAV